MLSQRSRDKITVLWRCSTWLLPPASSSAYVTHEHMHTLTCRFEREAREQEVLQGMP